MLFRIVKLLPELGFNQNGLGIGGYRTTIKNKTGSFLQKCSKNSTKYNLCRTFQI
jgi:hypothetical protein